jgi:hypothetical protein
VSAAFAQGLKDRAVGAVRATAARSARRMAWRLGVVALVACGRVAYGLFAGEEPEEASAAPIAAADSAAGVRGAASHAASGAAPVTMPVAASNTALAAAPASARATAASGAPVTARPAADAAAARRMVPDTVVLEREVYGYAGGGRRDPFRPLIVTTVLRPFPSELRLTAVAYDAVNGNSIAILRDVTTKAQHRVRAGQLVGRMRVLRIQPKAVVFAVEELGFSRRETLTLQDSLGTRQP